MKRSEPLGAIGNAIDERLRLLGMNVADLARLSGVSGKTISQMIRGERTEFRYEKESDVESGLGWQRGSFDAIRAGGAPLVPPLAVGPAGRLVDLSLLPTSISEGLTLLLSGLQELQGSLGSDARIVSDDAVDLHGKQAKRRK